MTYVIAIGIGLLFLTVIFTWWGVAVIDESLSPYSTPGVMRARRYRDAIIAAWILNVMFWLITVILPLSWRLNDFQ